MVGCRACGQTSVVNAGTLFAQGDPTPLADYGSILRVGARGKLKANQFQVYGRIRYRYPGGFWDEWLLILDGKLDQPFYLQEDEGEFILFEYLGSKAPAFGSHRPGQWMQVANTQAFVTELNTAQSQGSEGELPFLVVPGEQANFVDAIAEGLYLSIEYRPRETEVYRGTPIELNEIQLDR